jgi:hypothetical protein
MDATPGDLVWVSKIIHTTTTCAPISIALWCRRKGKIAGFFCFTSQVDLPVGVSREVLGLFQKTIQANFKPQLTNYIEMGMQVFYNCLFTLFLIILII